MRLAYDLLSSGSPARSECPPGAPGLPVVLAAGLSTLIGIAIDESYVYWGAFGAGAVRRVPICGGPITTLATDQNPIGNTIAVDATYVYWLSGPNPAGSAEPSSIIMRIRKTGGAPESLTPNIGLAPVTPFALGAAAVYGSVGYPLPLDAIPLDGAPPQVLVSTAGFLGAIAVDSAHVYWASGTTISEAPLDQAAQGIGTPLAFASLATMPNALVTDASSLYWTEIGSDGMSTGNVCSVPIGGGAQVVLASGQAGPSAIAVHRGSVFWTNMSDPSAGNVSSVATEGGPVTVLASGQSFPRSIAVDATYAYWTSGSENGANDGTIQRMAY